MEISKKDERSKGLLSINSLRETAPVSSVIRAKDSPTLSIPMGTIMPSIERSCSISSSLTNPETPAVNVCLFCNNLNNYRHPPPDPISPVNLCPAILVNLFLNHVNRAGRAFYAPTIFGFEVYSCTKSLYRKSAGIFNKAALISAQFKIE
jgi:hypothetical protein